MKLRPYQEHAVAAAVDALYDNPAVLIVMPTGLGKTVVFAHIAKHFLQWGRVLIVAHREELLEQAGQKIQAICDVVPDLEMGEARAIESKLYGGAPVVLTTVQTQTSGREKRRMHRFDPLEYILLIIDESHHSTASSYRHVVRHYRQNPQLRVLGVTATPDRRDGLGLGNVFNVVAYEYGLHEAIQEGWLVPIRQQLVTIEGLDFTACRSVAGDFNLADLERTIGEEAILHRIAGATVQAAGDRKTLVFADSVQNGERLTEIFNRPAYKPGSARFVSGKTDRDERREIVRAYRAGEFQFLVNVGIATEGFDVPDIGLVAMARPTKSRALYCQMIGRGTRPLASALDGLSLAAERRAAIAASGKPDLVVLDFVGVAGRHKLIHATDILAGKECPELAELAEREIAKSAGPVDVETALAEARREEQRRREAEEARQRAAIAAKVTYSTREIDPFDVLDLEAPRQRAWNRGLGATEKQRELLRRFGVDGIDSLSKDDATALIGELLGRREKGLCTYKQSKVLKAWGHEPAEMSFEEASQIIGSHKRSPIRWAGRQTA